MSNLLNLLRYGTEDRSPHLASKNRWSAPPGLPSTYYERAKPTTLELLTARAEFLEAKLAQIEEYYQQNVIRINLYKALGGGSSHTIRNNEIPCNTIIWRGVALAVLLLLLPYKIAKAQQAEPYYWEWRAGLDYLFSNDEFGGSRHRSPPPPTEAYGLQVAWLCGGEPRKATPATHSVHTALHSLKMQGMPHTIIDKGAITAYYQYQNSYTRLRIGAMLRQEVVGNYPSAFFTDSLLFISQGSRSGMAGKGGRMATGAGVAWIGRHSVAREQMESFQAGD